VIHYEQYGCLAAVDRGLFVLCCAAAGAVLGAAAGSEEAPVGSLPVFKLALRPTYWLVRKVFARFTTTAAAR
jgi:hypothetical protein